MGRAFHEITKKWMKAVFLLGCYRCIFYGNGNSAQLCQNFGISGGGGLNMPNPPSVRHWFDPPRYATGLTCIFCFPPHLTNTVCFKILVTFPFLSWITQFYPCHEMRSVQSLAWWRQTYSQFVLLIRKRDANINTLVSVTDAPVTSSAGFYYT